VIRTLDAMPVLSLSGTKSIPALRTRAEATPCAENVEEPVHVNVYRNITATPTKDVDPNA